MIKYTENKIRKVVETQKAYFRTNDTLDIDFRIAQLKKLRKAILDYEERIEHALKEDLNRADFETYLCDIGPTIMEINETIKGLRKWAKPEKHFSGLLNFPSIFTHVYKVPYGTTLIISPYNFPIVLSLGVLAAAIAGGNTAVIKVSSKSKSSSEVLEDLIFDTFDEKYVTVITGSHNVADMCLEQKFDKIFYTGSPKVAKHVLAKAAENLTPVALELGGETGNWCIIRSDADIKDAARKIAFFKILNAGQICININQVAVADDIADKFVEELEKQFEKQIGKYPDNNIDYPKLISKQAYEKCASDVEKYRDKVVYGGFGDKENRRYVPTILYPININDDIVRKENFCPILPIVKYKDEEIDQLLDTIKDREKALALYLFTKDMKWANETMQTMQYGGGCINEVCLQMTVKGVPFNGTGHSGMGAYHGEWGFREFSHPQTVLTGSNKFNLSLREHPYKIYKKSFIKMLER